MAKKIYKNKYRGHTFEWDEDSQGKLLQTVFVEVSPEENKKEQEKVYSTLKELNEDANAQSPAKVKNGNVYEKQDEKWVKVS